MNGERTQSLKTGIGGVQSIGNSAEERRDGRAVGRAVGCESGCRRKALISMMIVTETEKAGTY
jgi:hypothetical protein